ncbi:Bug family tripartite tricarboxylate transporter substrate binding protein [Ottowia thiooxydans]|uniref:Tripartite-type tricarboxylate transporter receptor subunit TctC n=1 Tax=Ottowia thiooxydans TaxID=219182 RepID=A0ABV2QFJ1_9BURK
MIQRRDFLAALACSMAAPAILAQTQAQTTISKPARFILGFPPGGSLDSIARLLSERIKGSYAPVVLVENRSGAGGRIAMDYVKAAEPDGSVVVMAPASVMVIYPHVYKRLSYDAFKDFTPVSTLCTFQFGFSVGPAVPAEVRTITQFAQWCKANPAQASFGSPGEGTMAHFAGIMVAKAAGIELTHVPYKGGAPAIQDVVGGQIAASVNVLSEPLPFAKEGRIRVLATTGAARSSYLPEVPTMREAGFRDFDIQEYFAAWAPPKTPPRLVNALAEQIRAAVATKELQEAYASRAFQPVVSGPTELSAMVRADFERWAPVVKSTGFSLES